jgi:parvulin-like peptidyl-prolyl isomerase
LKEAQILHAQLRKGRRFKELVPQPSRSPNAVLSEFPAPGQSMNDELSPKVLAAVTGLADGAYSDIIKTSSGYVIFERNDTSLPDVPTPEVQQKIREILVREQIDQLVKKTKSSIKIRYVKDN